MYLIKMSDKQYVGWTIISICDSNSKLFLCWTHLIQISILLKWESIKVYTKYISHLLKLPRTRNYYFFSEFWMKIFSLEAILTLEDILENRMKWTRWGENGGTSLDNRSWTLNVVITTQERGIGVTAQPQPQLNSTSTWVGVEKVISWTITTTTSKTFKALLDNIGSWFSVCNLILTQLETRPQQKWKTTSKK